MSIAIIAPTRDTAIWKRELLLLDPTLDVEEYPNIKSPDEVTCAIVWLHPYGILEEFKNLKLICSMGAGVDHILKDPHLPDVPVARVVSETIAFSMSNYVIMAILNHHRMMDKYMADQRNKIWDQATFPEREVKVGILGLGVLGQDVATKLCTLGFEVSGLSKSKKELPGVTCYGETQMDIFLSGINVLVCLLPMTADTEGILNIELFQKLKHPTYLISVGRGFQQREKDILSALEGGLLNGAFLDVFEKEPLPNESPLWHHPKVKLTPHNASITNPRAAVPHIYKNYVNMLKGEPLADLADKDKGY